MVNKKLIEGIDFNWVEIDGLKFRIFTKEFLLKRGFCCKNKCANCPYTKKK